LCTRSSSDDQSENVHMPLSLPGLSGRRPTGKISRNLAATAGGPARQRFPEGRDLLHCWTR
jgi:hypothetical protein